MHNGKWGISKKEQITEWIIIRKELGIGEYEKWTEEILRRQRLINSIGSIRRIKEIQWIKRINFREGKYIGEGKWKWEEIDSRKTWENSAWITIEEQLFLWLSSGIKWC